MGLFFDDNDSEKDTAKETKIKMVQPAVQQGFLAALFLMLLGGLLTFLSWIFKPLLTWMFTYEGRTEQQVRRQLLITLAIFGGGAFLLYRIPSVRDFISLSSSHTYNINEGGKSVPLPDRSFFVAEEKSRYHRFNEIAYITHESDSENKLKLLNKNECPLVPRSIKIHLASAEIPNLALGFEDEVTYLTTKPLSEIYGLTYWRVKFAHPTTHLFKKREELGDILWSQEEATTWQEFKNNWKHIRTVYDDRKVFWAKALNNEHAMICLL